MDSTWEAFFNQIRKRLYRRLHVLAKPLARMSDEPAGPSVFPSSFAAGSPEFLCATDGLRVFWNLPFLSYMIKENPAWQDSPPEEMLSAIEAFLLHQVIHCLPPVLPASGARPVTSLPGTFWKAGYRSFYLKVSVNG